MITARIAFGTFRKTKISAASERLQDPTHVRFRAGFHRRFLGRATGVLALCAAPRPGQDEGGVMSPDDLERPGALDAAIQFAAILVLGSTYERSPDRRRPRSGVHPAARRSKREVGNLKHRE